MGKEFRRHSPKPLRFLYHPVNLLASTALGLKYDVQHRGLKNYSGLEGKPVMILAKHQDYHDIPHEAQNAWRGMRRDVYFVMKYSLPTWMTLLSGVKTVRPKDLRELSAEFKKPKYNHLNVDEKKRLKKEKSKKMRETREATNQFVVEALQASQVLVVHPETTRVPYEVGTIPPQMLSQLMEWQDNAGVEVYFVPLDISYQNPKERGTSVIIEAKPPIVTTLESDLERHIAENIELIEVRQQ